MKTTPKSPPPSIDSILDDYYGFESTLLSDDDDGTITSPTSINQKSAAGTAHHDHHPNMSYLNHGAFGDPHPSVLRLSHHLTKLCYRQPMVYHRSIVPALVSRAKKRACDYLEIPEERRDGFSFVAVTPALFSVLASVKFQKGDVIVTSDMIYHSLVDTMSHMSKTLQVDWVTVNSPHGCDPEKIYNAFEQVLHHQVVEKKRKIKLVVFDHISSKPTVMFPVDKLCALCRSYQIPTLVDGAQVPGAIPSSHINLAKMDPTFYCVTFHKWANTPRGSSGGLYVHKQDIDTHYSSFIDISRLVIDGGWSGLSKDEMDKAGMYLDASKPGYLTDVLTQGVYDESTREYENIMVLPHCLDIVLKKEESLQSRVQQLRRESIQILSDAWNMKKTAKDEDQASIWGGCISLGNVALPMLSFPLPTLRLVEAIRFQQQRDEDLSLPKKLKLLKKHVVLKLWNDYSIEVPIFIWKGTDVGVRISFGRDVVIKDIQRLGDAVNEIIVEGIDI